ncbi:dolichyl-phosphate-mannose--protein mannosyltransferase, partial [Vibrio alfacsensis]
VMTDMALTVGLTLAMIGFYQCWRGETLWGYVGFAGLAIGLLAKGPVAIVLFGLAVFPWMVVQHGIIGAFVELWRRFPLIKGTLLMLAIA